MKLLIQCHIAVINWWMWDPNPSVLIQNVCTPFLIHCFHGPSKVKLEVLSLDSPMSSPLSIIKQHHNQRCLPQGVISLRLLLSSFILSFILLTRSYWVSVGNINVWKGPSLLSVCIYMYVFSYLFIYICFFYVNFKSAWTIAR